MNLFKIIAVCLLFAFAPAIASADVLLWQVDSNPVTGTTFGGQEQSINWDYALIRLTSYSQSDMAIYRGTGGIVETDYDTANNGSQILDNIQMGLDGPQDVVFSGTMENTPYVGADLDQTGYDFTGTEFYFYVELYDENDVLIGYSQTRSYSQLQEFVKTSDFVTDWHTSGQGASAWGVTDWMAVPEPSSGLLVLIGLAVAGLRRRRV